MLTHLKSCCPMKNGCLSFIAFTSFYDLSCCGVLSLRCLINSQTKSKRYVISLERIASLKDIMQYLTIEICALPKVLRCELSSWQKELYKQISTKIIGEAQGKNFNRGLNNVVMQLRKVRSCHLFVEVISSISFNLIMLTNYLTGLQPPLSFLKGRISHQ